MLFRFFIKSINFFLGFVFLTLTILAYLVNRIQKFRKKRDYPETFIFSLTRDQAFRNSSTKELEKFFQEQRFAIMNLGKIKILEIRHFLPIKIKDRNEEWIVTRDLAIYLLLNHLKSRNLFSLFIKNFHLIRNNEVLLSISEIKRIKKESFDSEVWALYLKEFKGNLNLITSQSHLGALPAYFMFENERVKRSMFWYSVNSRPIYKLAQIQKKNYLGNLICKYIDLHFVWNKYQKDELISYGVKDCAIVNSILFYSQNEILKEKKKLITFFDITPFKRTSTIYSEAFSIQILEDILKVIAEFNSGNGENIRIRIKPKRYTSKRHSTKYLNYLDNLQKEKKVEILDWKINLYDCISESMGVLATPYSSTVSIGVELGVPAAYYCHDNGEWNLSPKMAPETLLRNRGELKKWVYSVFAQTEGQI